MALLLMYLKSMGCVLELVRFLKANRDWLVILNLKMKINGKLCYKVPQSNSFNKFANREDQDKMVDIFSAWLLSSLERE